MSAYGDDPRHHAIEGGMFVCSAPPDALCRTSPTCECENWCSCDGSPEDAHDNHDGDYSDHCCMTTAKPGQECWLGPWIDAVGVEDSYGPGHLGGDDDLPDGPITCEWDDGIMWEYAAPALAFVCPRHRERAGMNRLSDTERLTLRNTLLADDDLGLTAAQVTYASWLLKPIVEAIVAARLASVEALHVPDPGYGDVCAGCRDECLYCEGDHAWPCPTIRAVLGSDAHTEQKGTGE